MTFEQWLRVVAPMFALGTIFGWFMASVIVKLFFDLVPKKAQPPSDHPETQES